MKNYSRLEQHFKVTYSYQVHFTHRIFGEDNTLLKDLLEEEHDGTPLKVLFVIDKGVSESHPDLINDIRTYAETYSGVIKLSGLLVIPGGEVVKNEAVHLQNVLEEVDANGICRHSFLVAIGGGAVLDMAGFAATIAHRGIRHIRIPTTVLSQNDSGIGVKNSVNWRGKKNFLGTFSPPLAVINDSEFLKTLEQRDWISGIAEAVKVALIKDARFFGEIAENAEALRHRDEAAMQSLIYHCARLHMEHIGGGDPFEKGSSRPLDFGHWAAHKLEQLTGFEWRHGEAVAVGMAIDVTYALLLKLISGKEHALILKVLEDIGFELTIPEEVDFEMLYSGLEEFREHLGGALTVTLINGIGIKIDVHQIDKDLMKEAVHRVRNRVFINQSLSDVGKK